MNSQPAKNKGGRPPKKRAVLSTSTATATTIAPTTTSKTASIIAPASGPIEKIGTANGPRRRRNENAGVEIIGFPMGRKKFDWKLFMGANPRHDIVPAPVSCFKHVPLFEVWNQLTLKDIRFEYSLGKGEGALTKYQNIFWIASALEYFGYFVKAKVVGYPKDFRGDLPFRWMNFIRECFPIGHVASVAGATLIPPLDILAMEKDWRKKVLEEISNGITIHEGKDEALKNNFVLPVGTTVEVLNTHNVSRVKVGTVIKNVQGRVHVIYWDEFVSNSAKSGFWCHEGSGLVVPKGWAKTVGYEPSHPKDYNPKLIPLFLEQSKSNCVIDILSDMKLEAVDPRNQSKITIGTVKKVLKFGYMLVHIHQTDEDEGTETKVIYDEANENDWFLYHVTSPLLFYCGFAKDNEIELTVPKNIKNGDGGGAVGEFSWESYFKETGAKPLYITQVREYEVQHGFTVGMKLEAVDFVTPALICVATIAAVKGRLLKIHFDGWGSEYDQWVDVHSYDLFPIGWCDTFGYSLQPPPGGSKFWEKYRHPDAKDLYRMLDKSLEEPVSPFKVPLQKSKSLKRKSLDEEALLFNHDATKAEAVKLGPKPKIARRSIDFKDIPLSSKLKERLQMKNPKADTGSK